MSAGVDLRIVRQWSRVPDAIFDLRSGNLDPLQRACLVLAVVKKSGFGKMKHIELRELALQDWVKAGRVNYAKVASEDNPADFLTKWIPAPKLEQSLRYACNSHALHAVCMPPPPEGDTLARHMR